MVRDEKDDRLLTHQIRRPRLTKGEKNPQTHQATKEQDSVPLEKLKKKPSCKFWHPPVCQNYKSGTGCKHGKTTAVLVASGEVHTNEEAQVYVHDLNLFETVQLLEETPAVLSLGKLCEDHGYSCEWVSGQKPRLTKEVKTIVCKTDNFVPLVVPGPSTSSGSNSSSASSSRAK